MGVRCFSGCHADLIFLRNPSLLRRTVHGRPSVPLRLKYALRGPRPRTTDPPDRRAGPCCVRLGHRRARRLVEVRAACRSPYVNGRPKRCHLFASWQVPASMSADLIAISLPTRSETLRVACCRVVTLRLGLCCSTSWRSNQHQHGKNDC